MVEVCLDGTFGREHRKLVSVVPVGFGLGGAEMAQEGRRKALGEVSGWGEEENQRLSRLLYIEEDGTCSRSTCSRHLLPGTCPPPRFPLHEVAQSRNVH
jgi:hypothetical protein